MNKHVGRCSCGDIEFCVDGDPINSVFCYCKECQALTGSDKWFGLWIPHPNFTVTKGAPLSYTRLGDSGKKVNYHFCGTCSTTLYADITAGGFYSVSATALRNDALKPTMSIYTASAPSWATFPNDVPTFETLPPGLGSKA